MKRLLVALLLWSATSISWAGSIFLTGHDPDFHALVGGNSLGAQHINQSAINFILDSAFNPFVATAPKFIVVQSHIPIPGGHVDGRLGIAASGYVEGVDFDVHDASTLNAALNGLGTLYSGIVVASDFGGLLTQAELDILNARSTDIINFLNAGGGLYAMAESNNGAHLTPAGGRFGFLPFVVTGTSLDQSETGFTVTAFGAALGLTAADINGNASHNFFPSTFGMNVVDLDAQGNIMSLASRALVTPGGVGDVPEPSTYLMAAMGIGMIALAKYRRRRIR